MSKDARNVAEIELEIEKKSRELKDLMKALREARGEDELATFLDIELAAGEIGRKVTGEIVTGVLADQASQWKETQEVVTCPVCDKCCRERIDEAGNPMSKEAFLMTLHGRVRFEEPVYRCSACRRDFFPSTH